jgi:hypothetical protein
MNILNKQLPIVILVAFILTALQPVVGGTTEGSDGRRIAYPADWRTIEGSDGRRIAYSEGNDVDVALLSIRDFPKELMPHALLLLESMGYINSDGNRKSNRGKKGN